MAEYFDLYDNKLLETIPYRLEEKIMEAVKEKADDFDFDSYEVYENETSERTTNGEL